jgi:hypothetical protein
MAIDSQITICKTIRNVRVVAMGGSSEIYKDALTIREYRMTMRKLRV